MGKNMNSVNNSVLITGIGGEIGRALCLNFLKSGSFVVGIDNNLDSLASLENNIIKSANSNSKLRLFKGDVTKRSELSEIAKNLSSNEFSITTVINNAGGAYSQSLSKITDENWDKDILLNLTSCRLVIDIFHKFIPRKGNGSIINISSVNAMSYLGHPGYSAAKAGLNQYTKALCVELGPEGIRANVICPGTIASSLWNERIKKEPNIFSKLSKWYPLGNIVSGEDVANAAQFLASSLAKNISGVILPVDAGLTAGLMPMIGELT